MAGNLCLQRKTLWYGSQEWLQSNACQDNGNISTETFRGTLIDESSIDGSPSIPSPGDSRSQAGTLQQWIDNEGIFDRSRQFAGKEMTGGLRLLCFDWGSWPLSLPFTGPELKSMIKKQGLSKSFPSATLANHRPFLPHYLVDVQPKGVSPENFGIDVVWISSPMMHSRMELVLSYNLKTKITYGLLGVYDRRRQDHLNELTVKLESSPELCVHPMLLPSLACDAWHYRARDMIDDSHYNIEQIQRETGLLKPLFEYIDEGQESALNEGYESLHARVVEVHQLLTDTLPSFVNDAGSALSSAFEGQLQHFQLDRSADEELRTFVNRINGHIRVTLDHRERLLMRVNVQLQVLYNLMQQRDSRINLQIGQETKGDSSAMKTLSLITAIFLPLTAVASMFSMDLFFVESDSRITLSPKFWIYWAVVLPLTVVVLGGWIFWINRKQFFSRWRPKFRTDEESLSDLKHD